MTPGPWRKAAVPQLLTRGTGPRCDRSTFNLGSSTFNWCVGRYSTRLRFDTDEGNPMKSLLWLVMFAVLIAVAIAVIKGKEKSAKRKKEEEGEKDIRAKRPLTQREQSMFLRLRSTFPDCVVLSQVAFSALLPAGSQPPATGSTGRWPILCCAQKPLTCWR